MPDGEDLVAEPTLESLQADMKAMSTLLRELTSALQRRRSLNAGVDVDVAAVAGVAAKEAFGSGELGQWALDLLSSSLSAQTLKSYAGILSQFTEFRSDSENISPLEATKD
eukprot:jgi/Tetstr1/424799/TSEL_015302.t1